MSASVSTSPALPAALESRAARELAANITELARQSGRSQIHVMEVCGTHTVAIARSGIRSLLPENVKLISGPGCPVCVTPPGYIDAAIELAKKGCAITTFGDMLLVPGSESSLAEARAAGARVEICYSPADALTLTAAGDEVVFLGIGFETTAAPLAAMLDTELPPNFTMLTSIKCVPPVLSALMQDEEVRLDALLCPPHVSAIIGPQAYAPFAGKGGMPCVIAGFEPLDILLALREILSQVVRGAAEVTNLYPRVVREEGNLRALAALDRNFRPADVAWRGIGTIPGSGLVLREPTHDAEARHGVPVKNGTPSAGCACGDVIKGILRPEQCPHFGRRCVPDDPLGPCMVSAEGACAAAHRYGGGDAL